MIDGTGNEIGSAISSVLKLYRMLPRDDDQRLFYNPGVGTIGMRNPWQRAKQRFRGVFGLATGYGLDEDVLRAYRFLCETYEKDDRVWLFGFSRGAYAVRVLAAFVNVMGLLPIDQLNLAEYAFTSYKASTGDHPEKSAAVGQSSQLQVAWDFSRTVGGYPIRFAFIGVWDTVASVIVPRSDQLLPGLQTLRFTRTNPSVEIFRQAMAIDERRRMFRLNRWTEPQPFRRIPYTAASERPQHIAQVWFAGVHADIGGGYPEAESGLSKYPLEWMVGEATAAGLRVDMSMFRHLVLGEQRPGSRHVYVAASTNAKLHDSLTPAWKVLEWFPKTARWREWPGRCVWMGWYFPCGEPRVIPEGANLHVSVDARRRDDPTYKPCNLPVSYEVVSSRTVRTLEKRPDITPRSGDTEAGNGWA